MIIKNNVVKLAAALWLIIGSHSFASASSSSSLTIKRLLPLAQVKSNNTSFHFANKWDFVAHAEKFEAGHSVTFDNEPDNQWIVERDTRDLSYSYGKGDTDIRRVFLRNRKPLKTFCMVPLMYQTKIISGRDDLDPKGEVLGSGLNEKPGKRWSFYAKALPVVSAFAMFGAAYAWIKGSNSK